MANYSEDDVASLVDAVEEELERRRSISGENRIAVQQKQFGWLRNIIRKVCDWLFGGVVGWLVDKVLGFFLG